MLAGAEWDVALLQECPPRWADAARARLRRRAAHRCSPRATRSPPLRVAGRPAQPRPDRLQRGRLEPHPRRAAARSPSGASSSSPPGPWPERRTMAFTRRRAVRRRRVCVANLHASAGPAPRAHAEERGAASRPSGPCEWAGGDAADPRRRPQPAPARHRGLRPSSTTASGCARRPRPTSLDHLLARGLEVVEPPRPWPPERREVDATAASRSGSPTTRRSRRPSSRDRSAAATRGREVR